MLNFTKHIKKILLAILLIQIVSSSILMYLGHYQYRSVLDMTIEEREERASYVAKSLFEEINREYISYGNDLLARDDVIDAFATLNRQELLRLTLPTYKKLKILNPFLNVMHFHTADTHSFLRLHRVKKFGDNLYDLRPIIVNTNKTKQIQTGFEIGKYGIYYRITFPVFKGSKYIGAFEFGIDIKYLISKLASQNAFTPFLLITDDIAAAIYKYHERVDKYLEPFDNKHSLVRYALERKVWENLTSLLDERIVQGQSYIVQNNNIDYLLFPGYELRDYKGTMIGNFIFVEDMQYYMNSIVFIRWISIVTTVLLLIISVGLIFGLVRSYTSSMLKREKSLKALSSQLTNVINGADLGYWDWQLENQSYYVNARWLNMLGLQRSEVKGFYKDFRDLLHPDDIETTMLKVKKAIEENSSYCVEYRMLHKNGDYIWVEGSGAVVEYDANLKATRLSGIHQDISERKKLQDELEELTITDALTQLHNRRYFNVMFDNEVKRAKREAKSLTFLMMDIDGFKQYNDNYGHAKGDEALLDISLAMKACLKRPSDYIFRVGGEEFGVIFSDLSLEDSIAYAEVVRRSVESLHIEHKYNSPYNIQTISIGLCYVDFASESKAISEIYRIADQALYEAKKSGKNRVVSLYDKAQKN